MGDNESRTLTLAMLRQAGACYTYTQQFQERFPSGAVELTVDLAVEQAREWDWYFAAGAFLRDREGFTNKVSEAEKEYSSSIRPYREILSATRVEARKLFDGLGEKYGYYTDAYYEAYYEADKEFDRRMAFPRAVYNAACTEADRQLSTVQARAFAEQYIAERQDGAAEVAEEPEDDGLCHCEFCESYQDSEYDY